jgi:hypothetical protein
MGDGAQIYLCKPGGQREGPYTLEQIRRDLAAKKYQDTDFWAWHERLPEWVPLYHLPELSAKGDSTAPPAEAAPVPEVSAAKPEQEETSSHPQLASGMPVTALERIFLFTTDEGPAASQSPEVARMLEAITGADPGAVRQSVPRDVVGRCVAGELFKPDGSLSDAVWKAMAAHQPELIQQARNRLYRVCVRTFRLEADAVVALVLFYNKQKL